MRYASWLLLSLLAACSGGGGNADAAPADSTAADSAAAATPVTMGRVERATLQVTVSAPGRTDALKQVSVRAPFNATLVSLNVADGDRVRAGQVIGTIVSRNSEAALAGAQAMLASANTPAQRQDAQRALQLARQGSVRTPLRAPQGGVVTSHATGAGGLVNEGDNVITIAAAGSVAFRAEVPQSDLPAVQPGQSATVDMVALHTSLRGTVHSILPADSSANLSTPVRIDIPASAVSTQMGLFGTAYIVVGEHRGAITVPEAAVLRDDINGTTRVAVVDARHRAHWTDVQTGITDGGRTEILSPSLQVGTRVILSGQVGLPDGSRVRALPDSAGGGGG